MKKNRVKKSRDTVPLSTSATDLPKRICNRYPTKQNAAKPHLPPYQ
jgi:hypothetical protein